MKSCGLGKQLGSLRRDCLDWLIPLPEPNLRSMLKEWVKLCHGARPHMALGPGAPNPPAEVRANENSRHLSGAQTVACAPSVLGGLHHEYSLASALA